MNDQPINLDDLKDYEEVEVQEEDTVDEQELLSDPDNLGPSITEIITKWNELHPSAPFGIDRHALYKLVSSTDLTERETLVIEQWLNWIQDCTRFLAGMNILNEFTQVVLRNMEKKAKKASHPKAHKSLYDQRKGMEFFLNNITRDLVQGNLDAEALLTDIDSLGAAKVLDLLTQVEDKLDEDLAAAEQRKAQAAQES